MTQDRWSAAEPYELFMGRWSRLLATQVLAWLDPPSHRRWLDVGCGTGAVSEATLHSADPQSLTAVDPSAAYVAAAQARLADTRVRVLVGEATALPLADNEVDELICGLVLNFVPDVPSAVNEMRRVLIAGGRATVYVWDYAEGMQMLRHFWEVAAIDDPSVEALDELSRFPICEAGALPRAFATGGWDVTRTDEVVVPMVFRDFDDYWTPFLGGQGPAPSYLSTLEPPAQDQLRERLRSSLPAQPDGTVSMSARAWIVTAETRT